jgi:hypothetical protein
VSPHGRSDRRRGLQPDAVDGAVQVAQERNQGLWFAQKTFASRTTAPDWFTTQTAQLSSDTSVPTK